MPENSPYFESVCTARALMLTTEESLAGGTLISAEAQSEFSEDNIEDFVQAHIGSFLTAIRFLGCAEQTLLLSYYLLVETQNSLAIHYRITQTVASANLRRAVRALSVILLYGGHPSREQLRPILDPAGIQPVANVPMAEVIALYLKTRSFAEVADRIGAHRPEVRRQLRAAAKGLQESTIPLHQGVGFWLDMLIENMSMVGHGLSKRALARQANLELHDPDTIGEFRVSVEGHDFDSWFVSKNRFAATAMEE